MLNHRIARRSTLGFACSAALLAGCQSAKGPDLASSLDDGAANGKRDKNSKKSDLRSYRMEPPPADLTPSRDAFTPQFLDGKPTSKELWEVGFSLHCGHTRDFFRQQGKRLAADMKAGNTALFMSHLIRTENELSVGAELMRVGPKRYAEAVYATLGLALNLDRAVTDKEVRVFLKEAGFAKHKAFSREQAEVSLLALRRLYEDGLGVTQTPFIKKTDIG